MFPYSFCECHFKYEMWCISYQVCIFHLPHGKQCYLDIMLFVKSCCGVFTLIFLACLAWRAPYEDDDVDGRVLWGTLAASLELVGYWVSSPLSVLPVGFSHTSSARSLSVWHCRICTQSPHLLAKNHRRRWTHICLAEWEKKSLCQFYESCSQIAEFMHAHFPERKVRDIWHFIMLMS